LLISYLNLFSQDNNDVIESISNIGAKNIQISNHFFCEYPDICVDRNDNIYIVFTELQNGKEQITLQQYKKEQLVNTFQISFATGKEFRPRISHDKNNRIWVVWSAKRDGNWDIYARYLSDSNLSKEFRLTSDPATDIRPEIAIDKKNNLHVVWESLRNDNFDIYYLKFNKGKIITKNILSKSKDMDLRPSIICSDKKELFVTWDRQVKKSYQIIYKKYEHKKWFPEKVISPKIGFNTTSSIALNANGNLFVSWKSNLQPSGEIGMTFWVYIKEFQDGKEKGFYTLANDEDWKKSGEDQNFEFPQLLFDKNNTLWVFGRPSQGFFAQAIKNNFKSPIYKFDVGGWGGRGQYVKSVLSENGKIYSVRRDIRYIYLNIFQPSNKTKFTDKIKQVNFKKNNIQKNNFKVSNLLKDINILFGDIHQHSSLSDGGGTADECYAYSKYIYNYDFAALTDHEYFVANYILPSEWEWIKIIGQQFEESGKFFSIAAYEWTTPRLPKGFGHKNIYFPDWDAEIYSWYFDKKNSLDLFEFVKKNNAIAVPHHVGWTGVDWENHDEVAQCIAEIVSTHGAFEYMGNEPITHRGGMPESFIQDALSKGLKFGLIGASDGHGLIYHHGIGRKKEERRTGLAGVIVENKTKEELFKSLKSRKCFATSGTPIEIKFKINNHWMGEDIYVTEAPEIEIDVFGTAPLHYVILIRDNKEILYLGKDRDEGYRVKKKYVDNTVKKGKHWYYLRIIQEDGEMAWSSPIWIDYK
jgi:histidinol phosphatase-like PHP family hydrolase